MTPVEEKLKELDSCKTRINSLQSEIISALFEQFSWLQVVGLRSTHEYDDSNNYAAVHLVHINGHAWDNEDYTDISYLGESISLGRDDDSYRAWLISSDVKNADFEIVVQALAEIDVNYLSSKRSLSRGSYIKENK